MPQPVGEDKGLGARSPPPFRVEVDDGGNIQEPYARMAAAVFAKVEALDGSNRTVAHCAGQPSRPTGKRENGTAVIRVEVRLAEQHRIAPADKGFGQFVNQCALCAH